MRFNYLVAQAWTVGDEYFEVLFFFFLVLVEQSVVGVEARLTLGLACFRRHTHPFELAFEGLATFACHLFLLSHALALLVEPRRVVALPRNSFAAVEFENPTGNVVEEVAVVSYGNHGAFILVEVLFEPVDALGVEVVGRLVEQQYVGLLQQQSAERHAAAFATRQVLCFLVGRRQSQRVHGAFEARIEVPRIGGVEHILQFGLAGKKFVHLVLVFVVFGQAEFVVDFLVFGKCVNHRLHALLHNLEHSFVVVEVRVLGQIAHGVSGREHHFALIVVVDAGNDFQQG